MEYADKVAAVGRYVEAFDKQDMAIIRDIYAEDAIVEDPVGSDKHVGIEAVCAFYEGALGSGAKLVLSGPVRSAANTAAFPFQVKMGDMSIDIIDIFEFNEAGKVVSMKAYWGPENM
ncbi:steroid delta-isomerase [Halioglobus sp. HI00S01]|uniref:nuclear transport factor 2 family protein n=1 Tax=Halioglobus sp. HI00S01 TaxID=1822214 RepID=UPI0007C3BAE6|nr:nuclear transport factor 2 family protein [Halioglobus sp. HI00S01]KZX59444.1 steroid delta-isomerase [Halioglobus sp. HI00S01]